MRIVLQLGDQRVDNSNTALEASVEVTLSTTAGKNLSLDDHVIAG